MNVGEPRKHRGDVRRHSSASRSIYSPIVLVRSPFPADHCERFGADAEVPATKRTWPIAGCGHFVSLA